MDELIIIQKSVLAMVSLDGYFLRYTQHTQNTKTYLEAYRKTEEEYNLLFGKNRYKNYKQFRKAKSRRQRKKLTINH